MRRASAELPEREPRALLDQEFIRDFCGGVIEEPDQRCPALDDGRSRS